MPEDDIAEFDLSDTTSEPEPMGWDEIDVEEPEPPIAPLHDYASTWSELDAAALYRGDLDEAEPSILERSDGPHLLYAGKVSSIAGEPESGKGWFAMSAVLDCFSKHLHVVYIDFEDSPKGVFGRLKLLGVPSSLVIEKFHYVRPDQPLDAKTKHDLARVLHRAYSAEGGLGLIIFDGITEALAMQGVESIDNDRVAGWFGDVPRRYAHVTQAAVLLIDHVTKATDTRGRYAIGAGAKLAAIDGTQFTAKIAMTFARGRSGVLNVFVTKDRPGHVRSYAVGAGQEQRVGDLIITAQKDGRLALSMEPPDLKVNEDGTVQPTGIQAAIVKYVTKYRGRTKSEILSQVKGRAQTKASAFQEMVDLGHLAQLSDKGTPTWRLATPEDVT